MPPDDMTEPQDETYVAGMHGSCREEDDLDRESSLQEELNEIIEAFFNLVGEDGLQKYQADVESMSRRRIAEGALNAPDTAPDFELVDQDGEKMNLSALLEKGPVVVQFYRGAWCPLCNAQMRKMSKTGLKLIQGKGASFVGISPMLPDGTQYLSTKEDLNFPICSDLGNEVARRFNITFEMESEWLREVDADIPKWQGDDNWEVPLPATYVIDRDGKIVWSLVSNDATVTAEMEEIADAIPASNDSTDGGEEERDQAPSDRSKRKSGFVRGKKRMSSTFKKMKDVRTSFGGKKDKTAMELLGTYMVSPPS